MKLTLPTPHALRQLTIVAALAVPCWFSWQHYSEGRESFLAAQHELNQSASLANQIILLRQKPDRAAAQSRSEQSLAEVIEKSATASRVSRDKVARVEPQQPRRAGESDYLEHATLVQLDGVTLAQLASTLSTLRSSGAGLEQLRVSALRISAPYQAAASQGPESWNVELTLSYFVYSPKTAVPRKS
jgi:hypothetical protein